MSWKLKNKPTDDLAREIRRLDWRPSEGRWRSWGRCRSPPGQFVGACLHSSCSRHSPLSLVGSFAFWSRPSTTGWSKRSLQSKVWETALEKISCDQSRDPARGSVDSQGVAKCPHSRHSTPARVGSTRRSPQRLQCPRPLDGGQQPDGGEPFGGGSPLLPPTVGALISVLSERELPTTSSINGMTGSNC